jgi:hypothetical protein
VALAIEWAKKYTKCLREQFLKNFANEMAHPPDFFETGPPKDQPPADEQNGTSTYLLFKINARLQEPIYNTF